MPWRPRPENHIVPHLGGEKKAALSRNVKNRLGKPGPKDCSGENVYNFNQQYVNGKNSAIQISTTKFLVNKIIKIPTTTVLRSPTASSSHERG